MFKLHLTSELKEALITLKDTRTDTKHFRSATPHLPPPQRRMAVYDSKCIGCGACATVCPADAISFSENRKYSTITISLAGCIYCGLCVDSCPGNALGFLPGDELPSLTKDHLQHELQIKLKRCDHCRTPMGTQRGIAKIVKEVFSPGGLTRQKIEWIELCSACRRAFHGSRLINQLTR